MSGGSKSDPRVWQTAKAPTLAEFDQLAREAYLRLPDEFRSLCEGLVIRVEEFPDDDVVRQMGFDSEFDPSASFTGSACRSARSWRRSKCPT
jgi:predicted Zn-dependent protease with MMP-like domain